MGNKTLYAWVGSLPDPEMGGFLMFAPVMGTDRDAVAKRRDETDDLVVRTGCDMRLVEFTGCTVLDGEDGAEAREPERSATCVGNSNGQPVGTFAVSA